MSTTPPPIPATDRSKLNRFGDLIAQIYPDLRRIAAAKALSIGASPSSLAQETVCRLISLPSPPQTPDAALALCCKLMEWTHIDRLRSDLARRARESNTPHPTPGPTTGTTLAPGTDSLASDRHTEQLAQALADLSELSPRRAEVMMLSSICRMTQLRISEVLGISERTVQRDYDFARAWIAARLTDPSPPLPN